MRILSYNIHKGIGGRDRRYRLERIIEVIDTHNADIICLQEVERNVRRSRFDDQPHILTEFFHAAGNLYQLNVSLKQGGYGNLILSRWPFLSQHGASLRIRNRKPRGAQFVVVDTPEGPLQVVNCHLGLAERERFLQAIQLLDHRWFQENGHQPTFVIGDMNDWRNVLYGKVFANHGFHHVTSPPSKFRTFPAYMPMGSLDKAFSRGNISLQQARVVREKQTHVASDHLPILIDFHISSE